MRIPWFAALALVAVIGRQPAPTQEPELKRRTALIQWVADSPQLTYDVRFTGDSTTMPTALKYLVKDLAESEGWYLTGDDKSKTVASQAKRITLEYVGAKSKLKNIRVTKIEVKELPSAVACTVTYGKKPGKDDVTRTGGILETFGRKYLKAAKTARANVESAETARASVWSFDVRFNDPAAKEKK